MSNELPYEYCEEGCPFIGIENGEPKCKYREMHVPTVAVDFDKVLFKHAKWNGHNHVGEPIEGAKEGLEELRDMGFKIMIWTTRGQTEIIREALSEYNMPFDYINHNPNQPPEINPSKPVADYYIDDRGVRFTGDWAATISEIKKREKEDAYYPLEDNNDPHQSKQ